MLLLLVGRVVCHEEAVDRRNGAAYQGRSPRAAKRALGVGACGAVWITSKPVRPTVRVICLKGSCRNVGTVDCRWSATVATGGTGHTPGQAADGRGDVKSGTVQTGQRGARRGFGASP